MTKRGRKSGAELAEAQRASTLALVTTPRLQPPPDLSIYAAEEFRQITGSLPADFFGAEQLPILAALARHVVTARRLGEWIDRIEGPGEEEKFDPAEYLKILDARRKESAIIAALSRSLRLTNQSRYRPEGAGRKAGGPRGPRPWEGY